jgi:nucleoside-diphosphate-sugar epimerase
MIQNMPKALVTGANGFLGSHLCDELVRRSWEVRALVRRTSDTRWVNPAAKIVYGDVTEPESLTSAASEVEYIFHTAGLTRARTAAEFMAVNCGGTRRLLEAVAPSRILKRFVHFSSIAARGASNDGKPVSDYGLSKLAAEQVVSEYAVRLPAVILRLPAIYGPRDKLLMPLLRMIKAGFWPNLKTTLSVCYVTNAVTAATMLAECVNPRSRTYTVCDGDAYPFEEWARAAGEILGRSTVGFPAPPWLLNLVGWLCEVFTPSAPTFNRGKAREFACPDWSCSNQALEEDTGFKPPYGLKTALRLTIDWYQEQKWL